MHMQMMMTNTRILGEKQWQKYINDDDVELGDEQKLLGPVSLHLDHHLSPLP
jgi:hypothetical protein